MPNVNVFTFKNEPRICFLLVRHFPYYYYHGILQSKSAGKCKWLTLKCQKWKENFLFVSGTHLGNTVFSG